MNINRIDIANTLVQCLGHSNRQINVKELRIAVIIVSDENEGNANVLKREYFFFF